MNIQQLRTFAAVVERGSFSAAAQELGLSQPAVTMQIQSLEADLGVKLLDRRYRKVELTESGRALLPYAERVLADVTEAREQVAALSETVSGHLVIAASTTPGVYVLPRLLGAFLAANPEVSVTIEIGDTAAIVDAVESGSAQLGVSGAIIPRSRVEYRELGADELVVICPPTSPFAGASAVSLADLAEADWVMRESGSGTRQVAEQFLAENGVDPQELHVVAELGSSEALVSAVEGGLGVAMISKLTAEKALELGAVARVNLGGQRIVRPFFVVSPKGTPTRAAAAFAEHLASSTGGARG